MEENIELRERDIEEREETHKSCKFEDRRVMFLSQRRKYLGVEEPRSDHKNDTRNLKGEGQREPLMEEEIKGSYCATNGNPNRGAERKQRNPDPSNPTQINGPQEPRNPPTRKEHNAPPPST